MRYPTERPTDIIIEYNTLIPKKCKSLRFAMIILSRNVIIMSSNIRMTISCNLNINMSIQARHFFLRRNGECCFAFPLIDY